jgi:hypothetical protein
MHTVLIECIHNARRIKTRLNDTGIDPVDGLRDGSGSIGTVKEVTGAPVIPLAEVNSSLVANLKILGILGKNVSKRHTLKTRCSVGYIRTSTRVISTGVGMRLSKAVVGRYFFKR